MSAPEAPPGGVSPHCVHCLRWEGKHWHERARCSLLLTHTARLSTCEKFEAWPSTTETARNKQEASPRAATGYPFSIEKHRDKYSRSIKYAVHGFWSGDNVRVSQSRSYRDGKWEAPQINWSCGGREYNVEPSDAVAVECFGKAMLRASQVARRWQKDNRPLPDTTAGLNPLGGDRPGPALGGDRPENSACHDAGC